MPARRNRPNTASSWLKSRNCASLTAFPKDSSKTCSWKRKKSKASSPARHSCSCWNRDWITWFIVWATGRTRRAARQLVNHGHILVNGKKVDIPSYTCHPGDVISVKESSKNLKVIKESLESLAANVAYVEVDKEKLTGKFIRLPERSELAKDIVESNIVEFYNR